MAGKFQPVVADESSMGSKLVHYWGTFKGTILGEDNHTFYRTSSICKGCYSKELVSQSYLHISAQFQLLILKITAISTFMSPQLWICHGIEVAFFSAGFFFFYIFLERKGAIGHHQIVHGLFFFI